MTMRRSLAGAVTLLGTASSASNVSVGTEKDMIWRIGISIFIKRSLHLMRIHTLQLA